MFGGPLGDAPSIGVLCSVYRAGFLSELGPWEKASFTQIQIARPTKQDLSNHILLCRTNGMDYVPHS